ncbi:hypothetical protein [Paenibacillus sp. 1P03SA]
MTKKRTPTGRGADRFYAVLAGALRRPLRSIGVLDGTADIQA